MLAGHGKSVKCIHYVSGPCGLQMAINLNVGHDTVPAYVTLAATIQHPAISHDPAGTLKPPDCLIRWSTKYHLYASNLCLKR